MNREKAGYTEGVVSIITNIGLFVFKLWAGIVSGSIALTADAWHTLSDSISSLIVIAGVKLSSKKPDEKHPFGHGRWEQIAAIFIAIMLAIIAYDFLENSIENFRDKTSANFGTLAIVVTIISILIKEALAQYAFYIGRRTGNVSIKADGWHHRTDALSSVVVLIGILFARKIWWIDSVMGIIISVMLFYATYNIIKEAISKLLEEAPSEELIGKMKLMITRMYKTDIQPHHFHIHNYVSHQELTFHIKVPDTMDVFNSHNLATEIENQVKERFGIISTIHVEPESFEHESD